MKQRKRVEWSRLDNASKIFPATASDKDTKVFRLVCELYEKVEPKVLQRALDDTVESFPLYKSVLRRGVFWYYFEISDLKSTVEIESLPVCAPIYMRDKRNLVFRVFYYNNRINLEIFHALSDGTGALLFLRTLVSNYLLLKYGEEFAYKGPKLDCDVSVSKKMDDSFDRYFDGKEDLNRKTKIKKGKHLRAYHIQGVRNDENRMQVIEGCMPVKALLDMAHQYNTTLTIFIASLFIYSIFSEMSANEKKVPVVLSVPINLRQFFSSATARNFFSTMNAGFSADKNTADLAEIIQNISKDFMESLTEERLVQQLNHFMSLEKKLFTRIVPLPLKDLFLRLANHMNDRGITAAISNIGQISMPSEFDGYIKLFSIFTSARRPQICMCSYKDNLVITFTSPFRETEIQRTFFEFLSSRGIEIEISTNIDNADRNE